MKRLLLLPILLGLVSPVMAGLGEAEDQIQTKSFDVWCAKKGNNCTVTVDKEKVRVNGGEGISADQILLALSGFYGDCRPPLTPCYYHLTITYQKPDGTKSQGMFVIQNAMTLRYLEDALKAFTGRDLGIPKAVDVKLN